MGFIRLRQVEEQGVIPERPETGDHRSSLPSQTDVGRQESEFRTGGVEELSRQETPTQ